MYKEQLYLIIRLASKEYLYSRVRDNAYSYTCHEHMLFMAKILQLYQNKGS